MSAIRSGATLVVAGVVGLSACTLPPRGSVASPSASPTAIATQQPTRTPKPTPEPTVTPAPTPGQADVPLFAPGDSLTTLTTVRLRGLPGTSWSVSANLQPGTLVEDVLGPIRTDGYGWYLVRDIDPAAPDFTEGWLAAGFNPDPFLGRAAASPSPPPASPTFVAGYAETTGGDFGPFRVEGSTALRWTVALPPDATAGASCTFSGSLKPAGGKAVTFLSQSVSSAPAPGTTQPAFFAQHPTLTGDVLLQVASSCSWAVTVVRLPL